MANKSADTKRVNVIKVRYSDGELEQLKQYTHMPLARYIRETSLQATPVRRVIPRKIDPKLLRQLIGLGNNLNQLTKLAHTAYHAGNLDAMALAFELAAIRQALDSLEISYTESGYQSGETDLIDGSVSDLDSES